VSSQKLQNLELKKINIVMNPTSFAVLKN